jgi:hypothetical protein
VRASPAGIEACKEYMPTYRYEGVYLRVDMEAWKHEGLEVWSCVGVYAHMLVSGRRGIRYGAMET